MAPTRQSSAKEINSRQSRLKKSVSEFGELENQLSAMSVEEDKFSSLESSATVKSFELTIEREKVKAKEKRKEDIATLRNSFIRWILVLFFIANFVTFACIAGAMRIDYLNSLNDPQHYEHRIFDKQVLLAMIAAVTAEVGGISILISKWLFRN